MEEKSKEISRQLNSGYCVKMVHLRREEHKIKIVENGILHLCYFIDYGPRTNRLVARWTLRVSQLKYILQQDN